MKSFCFSLQVEKAIGRSTSDRRLMTTLDVGGRPAVSLVRAIAKDPQREMLLVEVKPRTGRTHQIRVTGHMKQKKNISISILRAVKV